MKKPCICLLTDEFPPDCGGVGTSVARIAKNLIKSGVNVSVVILCDTTPAIEFIEHGGIELWKFGRNEDVPEIAPSERRIERYMRLYYWSMNRTFRCYHSFLPTKTGIETGLLSKISGIPWIASFRGNDLHNLYSASNMQVVIWTLKSASAVTFPNLEMLKMATAIRENIELKIILHNGVEIPINPITKKSVGSNPIVATAGLMRAKKGIHTIIRACQIAYENHPFKLLLIGDFRPSENYHWHSLLKETNVYNFCEITGFISHTDAVHKIGSADVYIHAAHYDGCPNALLEAAASGRPIVCARTPSSLEILVEDTECLMYQPDDFKALAKCLIKLIDNQSLATSLGEAAKAKVAKSYSQEQETNQLIDLYQKLGVI